MHELMSLTVSEGATEGNMDVDLPLRLQVHLQKHEAHGRFNTDVTNQYVQPGMEEILCDATQMGGFCFIPRVFWSWLSRTM